MAVLVFAVTLLLAVLLSERAERSIWSTAGLFLAAGFAASDGMLALIILTPENPVVPTFAELALFSMLFTDGMQVGLPLTLVSTALLAHLVADLPWAKSLLLGAALSPTDPVFAPAICLTLAWALGWTPVETPERPLAAAAHIPIVTSLTLYLNTVLSPLASALGRLVDATAWRATDVSMKDGKAGQ